MHNIQLESNSSSNHGWVIRLSDGSYLQPGNGSQPNGGPLVSARVFPTVLDFATQFCVTVTGGRLIPLTLARLQDNQACSNT